VGAGREKTAGPHHRGRTSGAGSGAILNCFRLGVPATSLIGVPSAARRALSPPGAGAAATNSATVSGVTKRADRLVQAKPSKDQAAPDEQAIEACVCPAQPAGAGSARQAACFHREMDGLAQPAALFAWCSVDFPGTPAATPVDFICACSIWINGPPGGIPSGRVDVRTQSSAPPALDPSTDRSRPPPPGITGCTAARGARREVATIRGRPHRRKCAFAAGSSDQRRLRRAAPATWAPILSSAALKPSKFFFSAGAGQMAFLESRQTALAAALSASAAAGPAAAAPRRPDMQRLAPSGGLAWGGTQRIRAGLRRGPCALHPQAQSQRGFHQRRGGSSRQRWPPRCTGCRAVIGAAAR